MIVNREVIAQVFLIKRMKNAGFIQFIMVKVSVKNLIS